jgi:hypothetical protein
LPRERSGIPYLCGSSKATTGSVITGNSQRPNGLSSPAGHTTPKGPWCVPFNWRHIMLFDKDVSPRKLWSRDELKEGIQYFAALAKEDSYYLRHVKELISEMEVRNQIG